MSEVYLFLGPSLTPGEAARELAAICLPPAAQGDVYRVAISRPAAIGIVDGYFENVPSVWHKEILWALSQGVAVYGAASMGALRAAELHPFGMVGVGWIFEAFRDGVLEDDDEVAVIHGSAEIGYRPLSEPMVNIRRTLQRAEEADVISSSVRVALERFAKDLYYPKRDYPEVLRLGAAAGLPAAQLEALAAWLPTGRSDQKRQDAIAMLRRMRADLAEGRHRPPALPFRMSQTVYWERLRAAVTTAGVAAVPVPPTTDAVLEEARLEGTTFVQARQAALLRHLLLAEAERRGLEPAPGAEQACAAAFRQVHGLAEGEEPLRQWLRDNGLDEAGFRELMRHETQLAGAARAIEADMAHQLTEVLRITGDYARLLARAADKTKVLRDNGVPNASGYGTTMPEQTLLDWYFARQNSPTPEDVTMYATAIGFASREQFVHALRREHAYVRFKESGGGSGPDGPTPAPTPSNQGG